jgi:hypothetical protein
LIAKYELYLKYGKFENLDSWEKLFCITSPTHGSQIEWRDYRVRIRNVDEEIFKMILVNFQFLENTEFH